MTINNFRPVSLLNVDIQDSFWRSRCDTNRKVTLPIEYELCKKTGRIDAFNWKPGDDQQKEPHQYWDSDIAKWIEAGAYVLAKKEDKELERQIDDYIDSMAAAQLEDGYLNSYYINGKIDKRWSDLGLMHELYCAGHLMEAAVAYYNATGKRKMLDIMCRYADHIDATFGVDKIKGYPGHQEIELALIKLYRTTGKERYLNLAKYFIDQRGQKPLYFDQENKKFNRKTHYSNKYFQSHLPVREQHTAEGHSVRALYMYAGMADVAVETGDNELLDTCRKLWDNIVDKRMYITGGIGSWPETEQFSADYDLPNNRAYAETCAAIALIFFAHRMLHMEKNSKYADIMERVLYNGMLSGIGLSGKHFFYANPLEVEPELEYLMPEHRKTQRQEWFGCSCCPPNIARLLSSLEQYIYSADDANIYTHLYIGSSMTHRFGNANVSIKQQTNYPWNGNVNFTVETDKDMEFGLRLRLPDWCKNASVKINGQIFDLAANIMNGYVNITRSWKTGDTVELAMDMPVQLLQSHPNVRANAGCVAIQRGPLVYCLEEIDNGGNLHNIKLPTNAIFSEVDLGELLQGAIALEADAMRVDQSPEEKLYQSVQAEKLTNCKIKAIPYFLWANRSHGEMRVWIRKR